MNRVCMCRPPARTWVRLLTAEPVISSERFLLCMIVLFGYVVATGLPPTHWWRSAGQDLRPAQPDLPLTPDLHRFLALLRERHPRIRECWFLDAARAGESRLLAIADGADLDGVRGDWDIRRKDVRLYLLEEETRTVALAWGRSSPVPKMASMTKSARSSERTSGARSAA